MGCASSNVAAPPSDLYKAVETLPKESPPPEDFHKTYKIAQKIGKGCYAQVHRGYKRGERKEAGEVAVKIIRLLDQKSPSKISSKVCKSAYNEACLWTSIGTHPNCVQLMESFFDDNFCYMVMEMCRCSLVNYVSSFQVLTEVSFQPIFSQILKGMSYIHSCRICHRDIKPCNVLVAGRKSPVMKLADFGLAAYVPEGSMLRSMAGTPAYMCPEMLTLGGYDLKVDTWAFGVLAYVFLSGELPYTPEDVLDFTSHGMKKAIAQGGPPRCKMPWLSTEAIAFLTCVLSRDPDARASADEAFDMAFLTNTRKTEYKPLPAMVAWGFKDLCRQGELGPPSAMDFQLEDMNRARTSGESQALNEQHVCSYLQAVSHAQNVDGIIEDFFSIPPQQEEGSVSKSTTCTNTPSFHMSSSQVTSSLPPTEEGSTTIL